MPKFAVMLRYEVVSALIVDAESVDEADRIASEYEETLHETQDADNVTVEARIWGNGSVDVEEADDEESAQDTLDEWLDEIDFDGEDDDYDEYDDEDDDDDDEDDDDADGALAEPRSTEDDLDPDDDLDEESRNA